MDILGPPTKAETGMERGTAQLQKASAAGQGEVVMGKASGPQLHHLLPGASSQQIYELKAPRGPELPSLPLFPGSTEYYLLG